MNRAQRRAEAAKIQAAATRYASVKQALAYLAASTDPTISGATILLPDGEALYLSADTARAIATDKPGASGAGRA